MILKPENLKQAVAQAALKYVAQANILGVGTGSTVNCLIDLLPSVKHLFEGAVASSNATEERLKLHHISVSDLNTVGGIDVYIDGADEANMHRYLVKGRGGALTREKILAAASKKFVCIIDSTKKVNILGGEAPVPVEVIPIARSYVARQIVKLGGDPVYREGFQTDNGNVILDVYNLKILNPVEMEQTLNNITGVVENGLFACRPADVLIVATSEGIEII